MTCSEHHHDHEVLPCPYLNCENGTPVNTFTASAGARYLSGIDGTLPVDVTAGETWARSSTYARCCGQLLWFWETTQSDVAAPEVNGACGAHWSETVRA